jgi:hypothetical protein
MIRHYYAAQDMTAPAFRIEYTYAYTHESNLMRSFLVSTAAYRSMVEASKGSQEPLATATRELLAKNSEIALDFIDSMLSLQKNHLADPRTGSKCLWHVHHQTKKCAVVLLEAWQSDGAGIDLPFDMVNSELMGVVH